MANKWKEIWEKRSDCFDQINMDDKKEVFLELKRIDGFDVVGGGIQYEALLQQHQDFLANLNKKTDIESVFDVGCGCGANLYLFEAEGMKIGGIDYSSALIDIAKKLFEGHNVEELLCGEAIDIPVDKTYDAVISNSVFSYFPNEEYAEAVLDKTFLKAKHSIGLIDIHDITKKEAFIEFRKKTVEDYDSRYKDLNKLFYSREFFINWAQKHDLDIEFCASNVDGYWNNEFVFDVFFYKR